MSDNNIPNPLPTGTIVFVPDGEGKRLPQMGEWFLDSSGTGEMYHAQYCYANGPRQIYRRINITEPERILTDEMVKQVREIITCTACCGPCLSRLKSAFAPVLGPKPEKRKTVREQLNYASTTNERLLADAIDRLNERLDKLEAKP